MDCCLRYFDFFGRRIGVTAFEAVDDTAAIAVAYRLARTVRNRRTELWSEDRLAMQRSFPATAGVDERSNQPS
jgi:hypothetical protein